MNPQQFSEMVRDPGTLGAETITELESLLKMYPYCQTAQVLLTLNLLQQNHSSYQAQLKKAVAYAGDRKKLKELLDGRKLEAGGLSKEAAPGISAEEASTVSGPEPGTSGAELTEGASAKISGEVPEGQQVLPELLPGPPPILLTTEPEQENYIEESVISSMELELASPDIPAPQTENDGFISVQPFVNKAAEVHKEKMSQDELLSIVRKRLAEIDEEKGKKDVKKEEIVQAKENDEGQPVLRPAAEFSKSKHELIEKFINEEPQIARPRKEFFNPTASSHRSNLDDEDIVSETLALLYAKQGNMQKAIHIYEKLSLRFSEKSRYFAAQIENLKGNT